MDTEYLGFSTDWAWGTRPIALPKATATPGSGGADAGSAQPRQGRTIAWNSASCFRWGSLALRR